MMKQVYACSRTLLLPRIRPSHPSKHRDSQQGCKLAFSTLKRRDGKHPQEP